MPVYFAQAGDAAGPIKIGLAQNVSQRLSELQVACPAKLTLLAQLDGAIDREQELHRIFAAVRMRGEWFSPARDLLDFIDSLPPACRPKGVDPTKALIDEIALDLGATVAARKKWRQRGVPHRWRLPIIEHARDRGVELNGSDFEVLSAEDAA